MAIPKRTTRKVAKPAIPAELLEKWKLQKQAARARSKLIPPAAPPSAGPALDELLAVTNKLVERKPRLSTRKPVVGPQRFGFLRFVETPPYAGVVDRVTEGTAKFVAQADPSAGEMSCGATTQFDQASVGYVAVGIELDYGALLGPSRVTVTPDLEIAYGWVLNSLGPAAFAAISVWIEVTKQGSNDLVASGSLFDWSLSANGALQFDFASVAPGRSLSWDVPAAKSIYSISIKAFCGVSGYGWPRSVASAQVNVRIPSVTFDLSTGEPTFAQP